MRTIYGLPAHPLLVHLAVVLVPVTGIAVILAMFRPAWRRRYHVVLFVMSVVGLLSIFVARQTGEEMYKWMNRDPPVAHHRSLANGALILMLLFTAATGAVAFVERRAVAASDGRRRTATMVTSALALVTAVLVTVWVVRTGHEGARLTWKVTVQGK